MPHQQLPRLSRLPPSVESLSMDVGTDADVCDLAAVLEAAARAPGVRALRVWSKRSRLQHSRLADAARAAARLHTLEVSKPSIKLDDACALTMMPGLKRLAFLPGGGLTVNDPGMRSLVARHAASGLQITVLPLWQGSEVPHLEPW